MITFSRQEGLTGFASFVRKMDCLKTILFMLILVANGEVLPKNTLEKNIIVFLNELRGGTATDSLLVPSLKSIKIPPVDYYYGLKLDYSVGEMQLNGLDHFTIENVNANVKTMEMSVTLKFPTLTLFSDSYKIKGRAFLLYPLSGSGKMRLIFRDSVITAAARFGKTINGGTQIEEFALNFHVKKIEANLENSSWPINKILSKDGVNILEGHRSKIADAMKDYVVPTLNNYLEKVPYSYILKVAT